MSTSTKEPDAAATRLLTGVGDWLVIAALAAVITAPLLIGFRELDPAEVRRLEMREPAPAPSTPTTVDEVLSFPPAFEAWFNDVFGGRRWLVENQMKLQGDVLGSSPSPLVVMGDDGWLYYTKNDLFADHRGELRLTDAELEQWREALETREAYLRSRGIPFVFAFAPNKATACPEHLPARMRGLPPQRTRLDQLVAHLEATSRFRLVDMRALLRDLARSEQIYYATDSHWNPVGALAGYQAIMAALQRQGVERTALTREDFRVVEEDRQGDLQRMLGYLDLPPERTIDLRPKKPLGVKRVRDLEDVLKQVPKHFGMWAEPIVYENPGQEGVLLMFRDSFAYPQLPWFASHFGRSYFLSARSTDPNSIPWFVERLKPTVVVEQRVERNFWIPR